MARDAAVSVLPVRSVTHAERWSRKSGRTSPRRRRWVSVSVLTSRGVCPWREKHTAMMPRRDSGSMTGSKHTRLPARNWEAAKRHRRGRPRWTDNDHENVQNGGKIANSATTNYACADHCLTYFRLPLQALATRQAGNPHAARHKGYSESTSWTGSQRRPLLLADVGPSR